MKKTEQDPKKPEKILFFNKNSHRTSKTKGIEVLASKKEFGNAINRNRVRRRIKEAYRSVAQNLSPISQSMGKYGLDKGKISNHKPNLKISAKIGSLKAPFGKIKEIIKKEIDNNHV